MTYKNTIKETEDKSKGTFKNYKDKRPGRPEAKSFEVLFYSNPLALVALLDPSLTSMGEKLALKFRSRYSETENEVKEKGKYLERTQLPSNGNAKHNGHHKSRNPAPRKVYRCALKVQASRLSNLAQ